MRKLLISIALLLCGLSITSAANVDIQPCGGRIFRVRISSDDSFRESLLERYGILKTDWDACGVIREEHDGRIVLKTQSSSLVFDTKAMTMNVTDAEGRALMGEISFFQPDTPEVVSMNGQIKSAFSDIAAGAGHGAVIGDDAGVPESDLSEGGDPAKGSIIAVTLRDGERFYGGGSTSRNHINHRGELLRMHTTYQRSEIPMPFMMSSEGWGIFNNTTFRNYWDVGQSESDLLKIYTPCTEFDFYIFLGGSMPAVLDLYTQLTGRTYLLPKWAYGFCFGPHEGEDQWDILHDAVAFRSAGVPCDVFWLEPQWMEKRYDFTTSKKVNSKMFDFEPYWKVDQYPKTEYNRLFVGKLHNMGFHLGLWLCEDYDLSLVEEDVIAAREGRPVSGQEHWMDHLKPFMDLGVDGFKLDPARTINEHPSRKYFNGRTDLEMHNLDQVLLGKQMKAMSRDHTGRRSWHHYCAGWSGSQHFSAATSGDNGGGKTALFDQLNLGMSGFMNLTCDVMNVSADEEMQSLHFGSFLPWMQVNSWYSMMQPIYYNDTQKTIYRNCIKLRYELLPYIYSNAIEGFLTGMPMTRSMPLEFPGDSRCDDLWDQFLCGPSLLVGVFTDSVYLPRGTWFDAWTGRRVDSVGESVTLPVPSDRAGILLVRGGAIIPCLSDDLQYVGSEPFHRFRLRVFPVEGESSYDFRDCDAESYGYENGRIATRHISCTRHGRDVRIVLNSVEGEFENMPSRTSWEMVVRLDSKPSKVAVNGRTVKGWKFADGFLSLDAGPCSKDECLTVNIR